MTLHAGGGTFGPDFGKRTTFQRGTASNVFGHLGATGEQDQGQ
jgi:hypothetical protein